MLRYRIRMFGDRIVVLIAKPDRPAVPAACAFANAPHGGGLDAAATAATRLTGGLFARLGGSATAPFTRPLG